MSHAIATPPGAPILLLTTTDTRNGNTYYIVSRGPGRPRFANWPLAGAVAASAAAPGP